MRIFRLGLLLVTALSLPAAESTNFFGFSGPETFPIDSFIGHLRAADVDGDGLKDLVVVNNSRSKISILFNQSGKTNREDRVSAAVKPQLNELPPDARFRLDSVASEKRIAGLVVDDLNADGRPDLAYYGDPKELVVQYNQGSNTWSFPKRWAIEDGQLTPNALASGDLNGDGRVDLILLGENSLYFLAQTIDHTLAEPERIPYSGAVKSVQMLDVDGNGKDDLLLVNWDSPNPLRFRLQNEVGLLGPEIHFNLPPVRSYWADDLDGDHKTEIITVAQNSGRAQISNFVAKDAEQLSGAFYLGQTQVLPLNKTSKANRGITWGDVNGDHLPDLLVAEPDSGQLTVRLQPAQGAQQGELARAISLPALTGVSELAVVEKSEGEHTAEVYLLSPEERQVGLMRFDKRGTAAFPTAIPIDGKPLSMAVGALAPGRPASLVVIVDQDGKRALVTRESTGTIRTQKLSEAFRSNPSSMTFHDADQDGLSDLVVMIPYEKIKILRQVPGKDFTEIDLAAPGGVVEQPWFSSADVDGDQKPELLLAQRNFVRAVALESNDSSKDGDARWSFSVKDQINGAAPNSRIVAATALLNGTNRVPSLFLLDAEKKILTLSERNTNRVWEVVRNLPLPFSEFTSMQPLALGSTNLNSVGFSGLSAVGWLALHGKNWEFKELDGYETPIKDGRLNDVVSGDLNQDGRRDLVFLETAKNYLDLVIFDRASRLVPATRWQVFEERTFRSRRNDSPEPREALIVDLTGDGKNDLVVVVHDRVLVYPQE